MSTKTKATKKTGSAAPALPANMAVGLTSKDVCAALRIGSRKFAEMLATGAYPRPDFKIGPLNRWRVETHNAWVAAQTPEPKKE